MKHFDQTIAVPVQFFGSVEYVSGIHNTYLSYLIGIELVSLNYFDDIRNSSILVN